FHLAKEELQPWIDRLRQAASSQQPEALTPVPAIPAHQPPAVPDTARSGANEPKPVETPAESAQPPLAVAVEPAPSERPVDEPPPDSKATSKPSIPAVTP